MHLHCCINFLKIKDLKKLKEDIHNETDYVPPKIILFLVGTKLRKNTITL